MAQDNRASLKFWDRVKLQSVQIEYNMRYENDGYPPDVPGKIVYNVKYPAECSGCGYKKGRGKCPYCGSF